MSNFIFTGNVYFHLAVTCLLEERTDKRIYCIVDVDAFSCLDEMYRTLLTHDLTEAHNIIFIGGSSICSKILEPMTTLKRFSTANDFRALLDRRRHFSIKKATDYIDSYRQLKGLSRPERLAAYALRCAIDINQAAFLVHRSPKTIYHYSRSAGIKLNLRSTLQLRQYLEAEYTKTELRNLANRQQGCKMQQNKLC